MSGEGSESVEGVEGKEYQVGSQVDEQDEVEGEQVRDERVKAVFEMSYVGNAKGSEVLGLVKAMEGFLSENEEYYIEIKVRK